MNINIYEKYKVFKKVDCGFIDEENSTPNDIVFKDFKRVNEMRVSGGTLLEYLVKLLGDTDISEFEIKENTIKIEHFNPSNGEGTSTYIEIERG